MGRELLSWINDCRPEYRSQFVVSAFVSEAQDVGTIVHGLSVDSINCWRDKMPRYVISIAEPRAKKRIAKLLNGYGWTPDTFIHSSAAIGKSIIIGAGTIICPFTRVSPDSVIGSHVLINGGSGVGHDAVVGSYSSLLGAVSVNGNVKLGEGVLVGAGATIYPGKKIGDWARVGVGSVVIRNVKEGRTVFGNPATYL